MPSPLQTTVRDLHRQRGRENRGRTLAEGVRLAEEALAVPGTVEAVIVSDGLGRTPRGQALIEAIERNAIRKETVTEAELERLADTTHPQGIIAVVQLPRWSLDQVDPMRGPVIVLDGVQDPGNTGTILRTALGLGASGVLALPGTVELANPKVLRGSMGAIFRLPALHSSVAEFLAWSRERKVMVLAAEANGEPVTQVKPQDPVAIALGNEGAGLRPEIIQAGRSVAIRLEPGAESLNVAVAAGILLYEVTRDR